MASNIDLNRPKIGTDRLNRVNERFSDRPSASKPKPKSLPVHNVKSTTAFNNTEDAAAKGARHRAAIDNAFKATPAGAVAGAFKQAVSNFNVADFTDYAGGLLGGQAPQAIEEVVTRDDPRLAEQKERRLAMNPPSATKTSEDGDADNSQDENENKDTTSPLGGGVNPPGNTPKVYTNKDLEGYDQNANVVPAFRPNQQPALQMPPSADDQHQRRMDQQAALLRQRGNGLTRADEVFTKAKLQRLQGKGGGLTRAEARQVQALQSTLGGAEDRARANSEMATAMESGTFENAAERANKQQLLDGRVAGDLMVAGAQGDQRRQADFAKAQLERPQQLRDAYAKLLQSARENVLGSDQSPRLVADQDFLTTQGPEAFIAVRGAPAYRQLVGMDENQAKLVAQRALANGETEKSVVATISLLYPELSPKEVKALIKRLTAHFCLLGR